MTNTNTSQELIKNGPARAVLYLRVSTTDQATRGGQAEGFSIPAQRLAGERKAESMKAAVVDEFVDRGESAKTAHRPELKRMLSFIAENPVDYVIVHKVDRLARNRADDVAINIAIKKAGACLVSCTENIDETPSGTLMHGIMSTLAEFYSQNLSLEVIKGSTQKAMKGGTVTRAPTGYLHSRKFVDHQEIKTVEVDPERAPIISWCFDQYSTGEWSLRRLLAAATDKGLSSRPGPRTPSKPFGVSNFNSMLKNDYYTGVVTYRSVKYDGNHDALVDVETFDLVQNQLRRNAKSGERKRVHNHYLKGSVLCAQCGSRLIVSITKNRHGTIYHYFICIARHQKRNDCQQQATSIAVVEDKIVDEYKKRSLVSQDRHDLEEFIRDELSVHLKESSTDRLRHKKRLDALRAERTKLLQAHYAGAVDLDQLKEEQQRITAALKTAQRQLDKAEITQAHIETNVSDALDLAENCFEQYQNANAQVRREMNQTLFLPFRISDESTDHAQSQLTPKYEVLLNPEMLETARNRAERLRNQGEELDTEIAQHLENQRTLSFSEQGSTIDYMVGITGLEPMTLSV